MVSAPLRDPEANLLVEMSGFRPLVHRPAETALPISGIDPVQRLTGSSKALLVEHPGCEVVPLPIARGHARALNPRLQLAIRRGELLRHTRHQQANIASWSDM